MKPISSIVLSALPLLTMFAAPGMCQTPVGTAISYQGRLENDGAPADGPHDLRFQLFPAAAGGSQIGPALCADGVVVVAGLFTTSLDFGPVFDGNQLFLSISVRSDDAPGNCGSGAYTLLSPRQPLTAAPYALKVPGIDGHSLDAADGSVVDALFVDDGGNVGIGTTTPGERLTVAGRIQTTSGGVQYPDSTVQTTAGGACVRTIAELRALPAPAAAAGDAPTVRVLGYSAPNDDGGGLFFWDASSSEADDAGIVIASDSAPPSGRWKRVMSGPVHVEWWGPAGDGVTDDTVRLQRAFDAAAGRGIVLASPRTYAFGPVLTIPSDVTIANNHALLRLRWALPVADGTVPVTVGSRVRADLLRVEAGQGVVVRRLVILGSGCDIERIELTAAFQQTISLDNLDGALQIRSDDVRIGTAFVRDFNYGIMLYFANRATIEHVDVRSYVLGVHVKQSSFVQLLSGQVTTAAPGSAFLAGNNGVLIENSDDVVVSDFMVHDAGEHAIRVGGDANSSRIVFNNIQALRPGGCGLKLRANPGFRIRDVQINGLTVVDAAAATAEPGFNQDGLRLEGCSYVTANGVQVMAQSRAYAAHDGIWVTNCDMVTINGPRVSNVLYNGIHLNDADGPVNQVFINNPTIFISDFNGILIDSPTQILRDITIMRCYIRAFQQRGIRLVANSATGGVNQPVILDGFIRNDVGLSGVLISTTDPDVHNLVTVY